MGTQKFKARKPKHKREKGRVRVQRRNLRGEGEEKRGIDGAGGLVGIRTRDSTTQHGRGRRKRTFWEPESLLAPKRPLQSAVQATVPGRERETSEARNAW